MVKKRVKALLMECPGWVISIFSSSKSSFALFICLLAIAFVYRIQLTIGLFTNAVRPFDFIPAQHPVWFAIAYLPYDFAFIFVCFVFSWLLSQISHSIKRSKTFPISRISGLVFLHMVLMILLLIHGIHGRLLFDVQTGFDTSVIKEAFSGISIVETLKFVEISDYLFLLFPFALFWLILLSPMSLRIWMARVSIVLVILLLSLSLLVTHDKTKNVPDEIRFNPVIFLLSDVAGSAFPKHSVEDRNFQVVKENEQAIRRSRSKEINPMGPDKFLAVKNGHPWNIVFFIMESAGTRYIFDTSKGNAMPMPFLHKICQEGWYLKRHYHDIECQHQGVIFNI